MARQLKDLSHIGTMMSNYIFGNLPFVFFLFFIGLIYIANNNFADKQVRRIQTLEKELRDMKWRYNAAKADLMLNSKQTEIQSAVEPFGLRPSNQRTKRILIEK